MARSSTCGPKPITRSPAALSPRWPHRQRRASRSTNAMAGSDRECDASSSSPRQTVETEPGRRPPPTRFSIQSIRSGREQTDRRDETPGPWQPPRQCVPPTPPHRAPETMQAPGRSDPPAGRPTAAWSRSEGGVPASDERLGWEPHRILEHLQRPPGLLDGRACPAVRPGPQRATAVPSSMAASRVSGTWGSRAATSYLARTGGRHRSSLDRALRSRVASPRSEPIWHHVTTGLALGSDSPDPRYPCEEF